MLKKVFITILCGSAFTFVVAQQANTSLVSFSPNDRVAIARNSIDVPSWHEKSFWPLYEKYVSEAEELSSKNLRLRHTLARLDKTTSNEEAASVATDILLAENLAMAIKKDYYQKVSDELNGILSLQFLQGEVVMDMMEKAKIYEESVLKRYKFHPKVMSDDQYKMAKHNTMRLALELNADNEHFFWNIYNQYEQEVDDLLGKDYSLISFYAGDPSDFTPAIAKRLGHDLLSVIDRELKLKQKYYSRLNEQMGPLLAARFLAWEDYYSLTSKMHAWAEAQ